MAEVKEWLVVTSCRADRTSVRAARLLAGGLRTDLDSGDGDGDGGAGLELVGVPNPLAPEARELVVHCCTRLSVGKS